MRFSTRWGPSMMALDRPSRPGFRQYTRAEARRGLPPRASPKQHEKLVPIERIGSPPTSWEPAAVSHHPPPCTARLPASQSRRSCRWTTTSAGPGRPTSAASARSTATASSRSSSPRAARTARGTRIAIEQGHPDLVLRRLLIGPDEVPVVQDRKEAQANPELTVHSAMALGRGPAGERGGPGDARGGRRAGRRARTAPC